MHVSCIRNKLIIYLYSKQCLHTPPANKITFTRIILLNIFKLTVQSDSASDHVLRGQKYMDTQTEICGTLQYIC